MIKRIFFLLTVLVVCSTFQRRLDAQESDEVAPEAGTIATDVFGVEMVFVPGGTFEMGINENDLRDICEDVFDWRVSRCIKSFREKAITQSYQVTLPSFWIDRYEVTIEQYQGVCLEAPELYGCDERLSTINNPLTDKNMVKDIQQPQINVNWYEAMLYCNQRGARLPTEEEWEYAASGVENLIYPWGNNFLEDNPFSTGTTYPVGSIPEDISWCGAYDMAGNLSEWVEDRYIPYQYTTDAEWMEWGWSSERGQVIRGGNWAENNVVDLSTFFRRESSPQGGASAIGFRCVRFGDP